MRRITVVLAVVFALLWQTVAMARPGSTVNALADLQHAVLHWQGESHHHHDDGSYHLDGSSESIQHLMADQVNGCVSLTASHSHDFLRANCAAPIGLNARAQPHPFLDGLLRPPRLRS